RLIEGSPRHIRHVTVVPLARASTLSQASSATCGSAAGVVALPHALAPIRASSTPANTRVRSEDIPCRQLDLARAPRLAQSERIARAADLGAAASSRHPGGEARPLRAVQSVEDVGAQLQPGVPQRKQVRDAGAELEEVRQPLGIARHAEVAVAVADEAVTVGRPRTVQVVERDGAVLAGHAGYAVC